MTDREPNRSRNIDSTPDVTRLEFLYDRRIPNSPASLAVSTARRSRWMSKASVGSCA